LKVVDLFAGCGGLSLGLEQAGFVPVFVNELNNDARATYIRNRVDRYEWLAEQGFHACDVKEMVLNKKYLSSLEGRLRDNFGIEHGELDLLVGGPPCQGFSGIGHRRSYSVDKEQQPSNHLYQDMAAIIHRLRPRVFMFENVRGLLNARWASSGAKGEVWRDVFDTYKKFLVIPLLRNWYSQKITVYHRIVQEYCLSVCAMMWLQTCCVKVMMKMQLRAAIFLSQRLAKLLT
jgi:DNA (cytosine-5)-methyltransferase 1